MKKVLLLNFLFSICAFGLSAQCNQPFAPSGLCETAPIICPLDDYCSSTTQTPTNQQPSTFCGSSQNNNWIGFIAGTTSLTIDITVVTCYGTAGTGIQAMVVEGCGEPWTVASNCLYQVQPNSTSALIMDNLTIGQTYFLLVDGFSGDLCDYLLEVSQGTTMGTNSNINADAGLDMELNCSISQVTLDAANSTFNSNSTIEWKDETGAIIGTDTTVVVDQVGNYYFVITDTVAGCISADVVEVTNGGIFAFDLPDDTFLTCDGPMELVGGNIPTGSQYSYAWTTADGNIVSGANMPTPMIDEIGTYELTITETINQCMASKSITIFDFQDILEVSSPVQFNCFNNGFLVLDVTTISISGNNLFYSWSTINGSLVTDEHTLNPVISSLGDYTIEVTDVLSGCTATGTVTVEEDSTPPIPFITGNTILDCTSSEVTLDGSTSSPANGISFFWVDVQNNPVGSGPTVTVTTSGTYQLVITDFQTGCTATSSVEVITDFDSPAFTLSSNFTELNCGNNFTSTVSVTSTMGPNLTVEWIGPNGFYSTDIDVVFSGNVEGIYEVIMTNSDNGCTSTQQVEVFMNGFEMTVNTTLADCDLENGTAMITTGLANPGYAWSNGATTSSVSNLAQGWYSVTLTDLDNNCSKHENFYIDEDISCKVVIGGYVINDPDSTCMFDPSLEGVECVMVKLEPLGIYTMTDTLGYYEFIVDDGTYTVEFIGSPEVDLQCPQPGVYDVTLDMNGSVSDGNHFYVLRKDFDLCISKFTGNARPGFAQFNCIQICNYSQEPQDAVASFMHDSIFADQTPWPSITPAYGNLYASQYSYDQVTNTFTWNLPNLEPGECRKIMWYMSLPVSTSLGYVLSSSAKVNPIAGDQNPNNNCLDWMQVVTGSYDPNDKRNMVGETQWGGEIYEDDITMEYALRFQNVGTDTAFTVVIRDTLDEAHLNVESIRAFTASHPMQVEFEDRNVLIFRFENILLPDSTTNEEGSNGWVSFKIDRFDDLSFGTDITNQASIYFDFNSPVVTNEVVNTLTEVVSVFSPNKNQIQVDVIPNITNDLLTVNLILEKTSSLGIQLFNAEGIAVQSFNFGKKQNGEHRFEMSLKDIPTGVYFILIKTEEGSAVKRVVKI